LPDLGNPGFEAEPEAHAESDVETDRKKSAIPFWSVVDTEPEKSAAVAEVDSEISFQGQRSLHLQVQEQSVSIVSEAFPHPPSNRLLLGFHARSLEDLKHPNVQPKLRVYVEEIGEKPVYVAYAPVGEGGPRIGPHWRKFNVVYNLPTTGKRPLRIRLELGEHSEVWVDQFKLSEPPLDARKFQELVFQINLAAIYLDKGRFSSAARLMQGYWPRYLLENVSVQEPLRVAENNPGVSPPAPPARKETPGMFDRLRRSVPGIWRF